MVGFSVPPELHKRFEDLVEKGYKTKSEFFRELLNTHLRTLDYAATQEGKVNLEEPDLAKALKAYWDLRALGETETIIVGLGIVVKDGKVLICRRSKKDKWVENLTWVFPGGRMESLNFEDEVKREVKNKTGLDVSINNLVAARVHPDAGFKKVQVIALYFQCSLVSGAEVKAGEKISAVKWVKPTGVFKHFTTSTCDEVTKFLTTFEKAA